MISCQTSEQWISRWVDGELSSQQESSLMDHLDGCSTCRLRMVDSRRGSESLRRDLEPEPEALLSLRRRIVDAVGSGVELSRRPRSSRRAFFSLTVAAAAALLLGFVGSYSYGVWFTRGAASLEKEGPLVANPELRDSDSGIDGVYVGRSQVHEYGWVPVEGGTPMAARVSRDKAILKEVEPPGGRDRGVISLELERENTRLIQPVGQKWH